MSNLNKKKDGGEDGSKGILKKQEGEPGQGSGSGRGRGRGRGQEKMSDVGRKSVRWDELNVTATLHPVGKDYGHVKISEVPTPFERPRSVDGVGVDPLTLAKRLEEAVRREAELSEASDTDADADDEESPEEEARRRRFKEKRKEHYREFARLRASLNATSDDEDGDGANDKKKNNRK